MKEETKIFHINTNLFNFGSHLISYHIFKMFTENLEYKSHTKKIFRLPEY